MATIHSGHYRRSPVRSFYCLYLFSSPRIRKSGKMRTLHAWWLTHAIYRTKSTAAPHHLERFFPTKGCNSHVNICTPTASTAWFNEVRARTERSVESHSDENKARRKFNRRYISQPKISPFTVLCA